MKNHSKSLLFLTATCLLSGCAVYGSNYYHSALGTFDPSPQTNFTGKIAYEPGADYLDYMRGRCAAFGGLDINSVQGTTSKAVMNNMGLVKEYKCRGLAAPSLQQLNQITDKSVARPEITKNNEPLKISLPEAQNKCADLGFMPKTEGFGKCVLQLSK